MNDYKISASILAADFARLGEEVADVLQAGADIIHFDVMDNHFVPNLTIGSMVCQALRKHHANAFLDVHLMIEPVEAMIEPFAKAGANIISFHPQAVKDVEQTIELIHQHNCQAGLAINPDIAVDILRPSILDSLQQVLMMSIYPGFGGQKFITDVLTRISQVRQMIGNRQIMLEVDGGIKINNIAEVAAAGADTFVAGTAIFHSDSYTDTISAMRKQLSAGCE